MKNFIVFASLVLLLICSSAYADNSNPAELSGTEDTQLDEFYSMMPLLPGSDAVSSIIPGAEPFRRCIKVRCPVNCTICICRCIKWA